jgi:UDP-2-acetamido-3-amino-2,3-dideoxy-glucuronate N-acetyltransferase
MTHPRPSSPKVCVVGAGYWGKNLLRNFDALGALGGFCEVREETRAEFSGRHPGARVFSEIGYALESREFDAVAIATPATTHGALVDRALDAGKHVFVEKPLCLDPTEAMGLNAKAERLGLTLMIGHLLLYHPAFRALHGAVREGRLGRLFYMYSNRLSLGKIRREENALWSFAPHDVSMLLQLAGALPETVATSGGHFLSPEVADSTVAYMTFPGNVHGHIFVSWLHPFKDHKLVVVGENGMMVFDDTLAGERKLAFYRHEVDNRGDIPTAAKAEPEPIPYAADEPLKLECQAFLDAVAGRAAPPSDGAEGVRVLRVLDACQRALSSGLPVRL